MSHLFTRMHAIAYRRSGGRVGRRVGGQPVLLLQTRGRRSGRLRTTPLQHLAVPDGWVVVASAGGAPRPPAWSLNLAAHPHAAVQVGAERVAVDASVLAGAERDRRWAELVAVNPRVADAAAKAGRDLDVILLRRSAQAAPS